MSDAKLFRVASQYWAHALTLRGSGADIAALSRSIAYAQVETRTLFTIRWRLQ
jgi:hypothetical protein